MSSYNSLNGAHAANNRELLHEVLRVDWGFNGFVVSDLSGAHDTVESIRAGLDIPMPGPSTIYGKRLLRAVESGHVSEAEIDERVTAVRRLMERTRADDRPASTPERTVVDASERAMVREAATAGTVLVRNERASLPIDSNAVRSIAVVGPNARATRTQGGGSLSLQAIETSTILDGLIERFGDERVQWRRGTSIDKLAPVVESEQLRTDEGEHGWRVDYFDRDQVSGNPRRTDVTMNSVLKFFGAAPPGVDPYDFKIKEAVSLWIRKASVVRLIEPCHAEEI